jgi:hypothetical protein
LGLFINNGEHPDVYRNNEEIAGSNQAYSRRDHLTELMKEQQDMNTRLRMALEELKRQSQDQKTMQTSRFEQNEAISEQLSLQLHQQLELQKAAAEKQEEFQKNVLKRLDHQEALTEKMARQLLHIRSILFERTNYLATKIEEGYKITSSYVYKLMTGSEHPLTFLLVNQKKEENQNRND